jgi:hypothetical protein
VSRSDSKKNQGTGKLQHAKSDKAKRKKKANLQTQPAYAQADCCFNNPERADKREHEEQERQPDWISDEKRETRKGKRKEQTKEKLT